jgi:MFS family permease
MVSKVESILLWSSNLMGFGMGMFGPLYAVFAIEVGGDIFEISFVYALYLVFMGIGIIVVGKIADKKRDHARLLVAGYALSAVAAFGYMTVDSIHSLLFVQILVGLSTALSTATWYALYDKFSGDGDTDGYVWGLSSGLICVFQGVAMVLGGWLVFQYSFDVLFAVMGLVLTVSTLYQARILRYALQ